MISNLFVNVEVFLRFLVDDFVGLVCETSPQKAAEPDCSQATFIANLQNRHN